MKFAGGNHSTNRLNFDYVINDYILGGIGIGTGYNRLFESTSVSVAEISNRYRRLASEFTNFSARTEINANSETTSC